MHSNISYPDFFFICVTRLPHRHSVDRDGGWRACRGGLPAVPTDIRIPPQAASPHCHGEQPLLICLFLAFLLCYLPEETYCIFLLFSITSPVLLDPPHTPHLFCYLSSVCSLMSHSLRCIAPQGGSGDCGALRRSAGSLPRNAHHPVRAQSGALQGKAAQAQDSLEKEGRGGGGYSSWRTPLRVP